MWPELEAFCRESAELEGISWEAWLIKNNEWSDSDERVLQETDKNSIDA
jgi:hypothetical protein